MQLYNSPTKQTFRMKIQFQEKKVIDIPTLLSSQGLKIKC